MTVFLFSNVCSQVCRVFYHQVAMDLHVPSPTESERDDDFQMEAQEGYHILNSNGVKKACQPLHLRFQSSPSTHLCKVCHISDVFMSYVGLWEYAVCGVLESSHVVTVNYCEVSADRSFA